MTLERWISPAFSNLRVYFSGDNPRDRWISPAFSHLRYHLINQICNYFLADLSGYFQIRTVLVMF
ncbi:hypothetical protein HanPSC8_Chr17g0792081 [Helianthus annuus]|nr:hypothetical protein HanPSC8_Chr17g0792081 [Helianthus annuus]